MSKLILSSCDFRNERSAKCIYENLPCPISECQVMYFPNEKATEEDIKSDKFYDRLSEFGFKKENTYVFNYYSPLDFSNDIKVDAVYISGGNTFGTLKRIRESGADKIIVNCVKNGAVYIGGSAGAHIATRSVNHVSKYDTNTFGLKNFDGLGLFDGILICHYSETREEDYINLIDQGVYNVVKLRDEDYIVIEI